MPRTCTACASLERTAIDNAIVSGESYRNIAKRFGMSPAGVLRHKSHLATAIVKAEARRQEQVGDSAFQQMKRVLRKAWDLLEKAEKDGDVRGAIVALREVRECVESHEDMRSKAEPKRAVPYYELSDKEKEEELQSLRTIMQFEKQADEAERRAINIESDEHYLPN